MNISNSFSAADHQHVDRYLTELDGELAALVDAVDDVDQNCQVLIADMEDNVSVIASQIEEDIVAPLVSGCETQAEELQNIFDEWDKAFDIDHFSENVAAAFQEALNELADAEDQIDEKLEQILALIADYQQLVNTVDEIMTVDYDAFLSSAFDTITNTDELVASFMQSRVQDVELFTAELMASFVSGLTQKLSLTGQDLIEFFEKEAKSLAPMGDNVVKESERVFEEQVCDYAVKHVAESLLALETNSVATSALTPYLPYISGARAMVEIVKTAKDKLG